MQKYALLFVSAVNSVALGSLTDFLVMSDEGELLSVNGSTLEATMLADLDIVGTRQQKIELEYVSENQLFVAHDHVLSVYDQSVHQLDPVFTRQDLQDLDGFYIPYSSGLVRTSDGQVRATTVTVIPGEGASPVGIAVEPQTESWQLTDPYMHLTYALDAHELDDGRFIAMDPEHRIHVLSEDGSDTESVIAFDFALQYFAVSLFESDGDIYTIDPFGEIYNIDLETGLYERYGQIQGVEGLYLHAATAVPAPTGFCSFALASLICSSHRRR